MKKLLSEPHIFIKKKVACSDHFLVDSMLDQWNLECAESEKVITNTIRGQKKKNVNQERDWGKKRNKDTMLWC